MIPELAKALEKVAAVAREYCRRRREDYPEPQVIAARGRMFVALDAFPAEPADAGEMVEVRADVYLSPACSEPLVCPSGFVPYRGVRLATITARVWARRYCPEVRAEVET